MFQLCHYRWPDAHDGAPAKCYVLWQELFGRRTIFASTEDNVSGLCWEEPRVKRIHWLRKREALSGPEKG
ncbi:hypothetical protein TNCV_553261 [Trichonephila clavipes]|nr:hypothetical protein TNCV_553261 [Trichonephila clavipes]